jgi:hypothetical protein
MRSIQRQVLRGTDWWLWQDYILERFLEVFLRGQVETQVQASRNIRGSLGWTSPGHLLVEQSQEVLGPCVVLGKMFGFMSLAYVRDYFTDSQVKLEKPASDIAGHVESMSLKSSNAAKDFATCYGESARAGSVSQQESSFHQNLKRPRKIGASAAEISCNIKSSSFLERGSLPNSSRHSCSHPSLPPFAVRTRDDIITSTERFSLQGNENQLLTQQLPSFSSRQGTYKADRDQRPLGDTIPRSNSRRNNFANPLPTQTRQRQLLVALANVKQPFSIPTQSGNRARLPSPLREVSRHHLNSSEIQLQNLGKSPVSYDLTAAYSHDKVISKRRAPPEKVGLSTQPKSSKGLDSSLFKTNSLKSLLSAEPSFVQDYSYNSLFLGRYRTPSTPELRHSSFSNSLRPAHQLPRSASLCSLKQLSRDQNCTVYISIDNPRLFLPIKTNWNSTFEAVKYRKAENNELKYPLLTPKSIIGPFKNYFEQFTPINMSSRRMAMSSPLPDILNESDIAAPSARARRTSSTVALAGSEDSATFPSYELPVRGLSMMHTVQEENGTGCSTLNECNVSQSFHIPPEA